LRHGVLNQPIAGASLFAVDERTGERVVSGFSGKTQLVFDPLTSQPLFSGDPAFDIVNGEYVIPVPKGLYSVGVEPVAGPGGTDFFRVATQV
jgi:hypothetical protein